MILKPNGLRFLPPPPPPRTKDDADVTGATTEAWSEKSCSDGSSEPSTVAALLRTDGICAGDLVWAGGMFWVGGVVRTSQGGRDD